MDNFAEFYQDGGVWMHFIALTAIIGAGVTIERFIFLFFRFNINGGQFFNQIQKLVMANNIDRAIKLCNAADKAALARVIKAGLTRANKSEADIAAVRGEFESKLNALLDSPGGRAYVAYRAASNVKFDDVLTFQSDDGIPSVLRLRDFAERFMGSK